MIWIDDDLIKKTGAPSAIALGHLLKEMEQGNKKLSVPNYMEVSQFETCLKILEKRRLVFINGDKIKINKSYLEILKNKIGCVESFLNYMNQKLDVCFEHDGDLIDIPSLLLKLEKKENGGSFKPPFLIKSIINLINYNIVYKFSTGSRPPVTHTKPLRSVGLVQFWNTLPHVRKHKKSGTKVYQKSCDKIERLLRGDFARKYKFDFRWVYKNKIPRRWVKPDINHIWTVDEIKRGMEYLSNMFDVEYWPAKKDFLPPDLHNLIFNDYSRNSFLFLAYRYPPERIQDLVKEEKKKYKVPSVIKKSFMEAFEYLDLDLTNKDKRRLSRAIYLVFESYGYVDKSQLFNDRYITKEMFFSEFVKYLRYQTWATPCIGFFFPLGKMYKRFVKEVEKETKCKFKTKEQFEEDEQRRIEQQKKRKQRREKTKAKNCINIL